MDKNIRIIQFSTNFLMYEAFPRFSPYDGTILCNSSQSVTIYPSYWKEMTEKWFFVTSDKNKLTERDVDNDIPHWEGLEHVKNSLFRSRRSRDGTHSLKWDYFCTSLYTVRYNTKLFHNFNSVQKNCPNCYRWKNKMFHWHFWRPNFNNFSLLTKILWSGILLSVLQIHSNSADSWKDWRWP